MRRARDEIERLKPGLMLPETSLDGMNLRDLDRKYGSAVAAARGSSGPAWAPRPSAS